jgi:hypothetical protein
MECWSNGILEYWVSNPSRHHSSTPVPMRRLSANEAYEFFSAACARLFSLLPWFPLVGDSVRFEKFNSDLF